MTSIIKTIMGQNGAGVCIRACKGGLKSMADASAAAVAVANMSCKVFAVHTALDPGSLSAPHEYSAS